MDTIEQDTKQQGSEAGTERGLATLSELPLATEPTQLHLYTSIHLTRPPEAEASTSLSILLRLAQMHRHGGR